jgi:hypothetical protein
LVNNFLGFTQNSFEKRLEATYLFSIRFGKIWEMFQPIGRAVLKCKRE